MLKFYLILAIVGTLFPYGFFLPWLYANGLDFQRLFSDITVNDLSTFAWVDVLIAAIALIGFILVDGKKHQVTGRWLAIFTTLSIGVSCGLPLYLYFKEKQIT
ncbi:hypothetical protein BIY21_10085 [Vibrio ponticus]|uniref:DUF2834 domain-containing protein n=2 Tax=Vibrio ponticus TaxID=265668 RepID=A0ABX3FIH3_9VIBR|nr:DUF2834 domain-containing protein [Vibrio ponticus]OLQ93994.1 hypothetical protein BIY21_10085 [Vibrio ponticus]